MSAFATALHAAPRNYLDCIDDALRAMESGQNPEAVSHLLVALEANANDTLARVSMGTALLFGGRTADAEKEYRAAQRMDANCGSAVYGLGLVALGKANLPEAASYFCQAQQIDPQIDIEGSIGYVKYLAGGSFSPSEDASDECAQALQAMNLSSQGKLADALAIWRSLQQKAVRPSFGERIGCAMTFMKAEPVVMTGWPLNEAYKPASTQSNLPKLSGNVSLKADLTRAANVHIVSFFVDGRFVGMTNTQPFNYIWDTTTTSNGVHAVKIEGTDIRGDVVSSKSMEVMVQNEGANLPSARVTGERADGMWGRLWAIMLMKPSASAINYNVALCARQLGDEKAEKIALERVLAANPSYKDAAHRLASMRGGVAKNLYKGTGNRKVVALTFDDGPKADTGRILDVLKQKNVKATFMLVGKQADAFPEMVRRIADEGHELGNHTYNHRNCEYLSETEITKEIFQTTATIRALTGREVEFVRPPGGHTGKNLPNVMGRFGLTTAYWSVNCSKYEGTTKKKLYDHVIKSVAPGGIILLHNLELVTVQALPDIIDTLRGKGYGFVGLSEMR